MMARRKSVTARPRRASARVPRRGPVAPLDLAPSHYIKKVDRRTGAEVPGPIDPEELLVHAHRDNHPVEIAAQFAASRFIQLTGNEAFVKQGLKVINRLGGLLGEGVGAITGSRERERQAKELLGVVARPVVFQFRDTTHLSEAEVKGRVQKLQREAAGRLKARGKDPHLRVLLTGATGFLGKEILAQAAADRRIEEVVAVVRPETVRDPRTKEVVRVLSPVERGTALLRRLHVRGASARKFRFVDGDIEKPGFGIAPSVLAELRPVLTHVVHCAASVSFDDPYEASFRANVLGCRNALEFSKGVQRSPGSRFVAHVAIETSYIHGRRKRTIAQESALAFPPHFYNNFYELTKAMASIETDRALVEDGLPVTQLLPSIVIGHSRTGNNRGDTKVVNAPINAFGRAKEALASLGGDWGARARRWLVSLIATTFPADRSAELNLVPVDRVAAGILAALTTPEAIGNRIHLATDNRIRSEEVLGITREELEINVRLVDPTLTRNVTLPVVKAVLLAMNEPKLANVLAKLGAIFGVYGEWGQPIHDVGNDVRILRLPIRRPDTAAAFRMLCRHNKYVQEFGRVRDGDEVARRERLWEDTIDALEYETGRQASAMSAREFRKHLGTRLDLKQFKAR